MTSATPSRVRVFILEDHQMVRDGLRVLLQREDDIEVVGEAGSVSAARDAAPDTDLVLLDLRLEDGAGPGLVVTAREIFPNASILVVSMVDTPTDVRLALHNGASGYVVKDAASAELITAVRAIAGGGRYLQPSLGAALAGGPVRQTAGAPPLTTRELDVLALIALGYTNAEVAERLGTSARTVEAHRTGISQKLGTRSRATWVRHAMELGLLDGHTGPDNH